MWACDYLFALLISSSKILGTGIDVSAHYPELTELVTTHDIIAGDVFFEITDPPDLKYTYRLRPAKDFGVSFSQKLLGVELVLIQPSHACNNIKNQKEVDRNVALIERGECSFLTKTLNAEKAGARAAIITEYNHQSSEYDYYIEMIGDEMNAEANIPAAFLLGRNGFIIRSTLYKLKRSYAIINLPVNLTFVPLNSINHPPWLA